MAEAERKHATVAIIGGGLTGLVTAFRLASKGIDFVVLEKAAAAGGVIRTYREKGFIYEAGPNTGVLAHPEVAELFDDLEGLCELEPADERSKRRLIWKNNSWHALPSGPVQGIRTPLFSTGDKFRMLFEPFRRRGTDPLETLDNMVKRRLGQSFLDYAVDPFISGIYAGDPSYLVPRYALPKLYALEQQYGSFIGGAIKKAVKGKDEREKRATRQVFSVKGGLGKLVSALETKTGNERIYTGVGELSAAPAGSGYLLKGTRNGKELEIRSSYIVSTVVPNELKSIFPFADGNELSVLNSLEYASVIQVAAGFINWRGMELNAFGGLVPSVEKRKILGILFPSSFLSDRAPSGGALISVFLGGWRNPRMYGLPDKEILDIVKKEIPAMLGIDVFRPDFVKIFRYRYAIPQYGKDSGRRLESLSTLQSHHRGLILGGNLHEGIGIADRIRQGNRIADHIEREISA